MKETLTTEKSPKLMILTLNDLMRELSQVMEYSKELTGGEYCLVISPYLYLFSIKLLSYEEDYQSQCWESILSLARSHDRLFPYSYLRDIHKLAIRYKKDPSSVSELSSSLNFYKSVLTQGDQLNTYIGKLFPGLYTSV